MTIRLSVMYKNNTSEIFRHVTSFEFVEDYLVAYTNNGKIQVQRPDVKRISMEEEKSE